MQTTCRLETANKKFMKSKVSTYILAEMASSHGGDPKIAELIIESAAQAQANGILLQIIDLDTYIIPSDQDYQLVKKIYFNKDVWAGLIDKANSLGLAVWTNVYDSESAEFCKARKIRGFKIHSSNLENEDLIEKVLKSKKELLLSVGGVEEKEIKRIIKLARSFNKKAKVCLMYGLQNFPTDPSGLNLNFIKDLSKKLKIPFGYQDHSEPMSQASTYLPVLFIAQGVYIIEKHITNNRALKGLDYEAALNPDEFAEFVKNIRIIDGLLNKQPNDFSTDELKYKEYKNLMKVVSKKEIEAGEKFSKDNLTVMRAKGGEIPGGKMKLVLNKKSKYSYKKHEYIKKSEI